MFTDTVQGYCSRLLLVTIQNCIATQFTYFTTTLQYNFPTSFPCNTLLYIAIREQKIAEIGRFFGEKSYIGGPGKETAMEKSNSRKSEKNRDKSAIFRRFFGIGPIFPALSGRAVHARRRRVWTDFIGDKSAINSKFRRFFGDFSGPWIFFQLLI